MTTQLADIRLLLLDVDGVLTDGSITYTDTVITSYSIHYTKLYDIPSWSR